MHRAEYYEEHFLLQDNHVVRLVVAGWKGYEVEIYKETDDGRCFLRYFMNVPLNGWMICIPGTIERNNWGGRWQVEEQDWREIDRKIYHIPDPVDYRRNAQKNLKKLLVETICVRYPDFEYVLKKWTPSTTHEMMAALVKWREHPDVEFLLAMNFLNVALTSGFYKLSKPKKKTYIQWIKQHPEACVLGFGDIKTIISNGISLDEYFEYCKFLQESRCNVGISYRIYKYLKKTLSLGDWSKYRNNPFDNANITLVEYYQDYIRMAKFCGHNLKDDYWRFPKDLNKAHDKVMAEAENIRRQQRIAEELERQRREAEYAERKRKEIQQKEKALMAIEKRFKELNGDIDGYSIFVTSDYSEWEKQAEALHQCIVASGYYEGTADGKYTIVFIQKNGEPVATAQIHTDGTIGQFYANEIDRANCLPSDEVREAFNKWLETVPKSKFKTRRPRKKKVAAEVAA